ncbi:YczE/YyaS/YitT family protein [Protofrankia symbiont of Coriaria ruscifolia]|nr:hypothetical protein [Protofrankia symbiont of Coriaria ruscifolia]
MGLSARRILSNARWSEWNPGRLTVYLVGCIFFSIGATFFIVSDLGTDPLDVFVLGVKEHISITIGIGQASVALVCITIWSLWNRCRPVVLPFITFFLCGSIIDLLLAVELAEETHIHRVGLMLVGGVLCAYGSTLIIMSAIGIRAMDLLAITMVRRWRWPFWASKGSLEALLLVAGWLLGGPVGVGTLCFLLSVNLLIQPMIAATERLTSITNLGLPTRTSASAPEAG